MGVARPVRALGLGAIILWCFFLYQIFSPDQPRTNVLKPQSLEHDPMVDRTSSPHREASLRGSHESILNPRGLTYCSLF